MKITKSKLHLTLNEKSTLNKTNALLENIADAMDRAISVPWCAFDDDEIMGAVDIITNILENCELL